jgi:Uma2 family endonuclease
MSPVLGSVSSTAGAPILPTEPIWRMSVERYHEMIEAGILTEDDPVELLEGWLVEKMPKNSPHRKANRRMRLILERLAPAGWFVDAQEPITTADSEPEPDLAVIRGDPKAYSNHPGPQDLALVVEVLDATLQRDRTTKQRIYARARVPVYWIVNLVDGRIEVYTDPTGPAEKPSYRQRNHYGPADEVPVIIEGCEIGRIAAREVLP